jgi:hypothetical protein
VTLWLCQVALWTVIGACGAALYTGTDSKLELVTLRICGTIAIAGLGIIHAVIDARKETV